MELLPHLKPLSNDVVKCHNELLHPKAAINGHGISYTMSNITVMLQRSKSSSVSANLVSIISQSKLIGSSIRQYSLLLSKGGHNIIEVPQRLFTSGDGHYSSLWCQYATNDVTIGRTIRNTITKKIFSYQMV